MAGDEHKQAILKRLRSIEGHVRGVQRMVEDDAYCMDVINQTLAVRRALEKVNSLVLEHHLRSCVASAMQGDDSTELERVVAEIVNVFETTSRK